MISDDARLQRPEYLGGGRQNINITPVPQTSVSATTPQGNLAAFGTFGGRNGGFVKSFSEHGVVIGLISVTGDLTYQNGLTREYLRNTRFDYFWPALQNLGEQAVTKKRSAAVTQMPMTKSLAITSVMASINLNFLKSLALCDQTLQLRSISGILLKTMALLLL